MKSIELTAYAVREYDVKYTIVLDENDPALQEILENSGLTFDQLNTLNYPDYRDLWDSIISSDLNMDIEEDFTQGDERYADFEAFISENK